MSEGIVDTSVAVGTPAGAPATAPSQPANVAPPTDPQTPVAPVTPGTPPAANGDADRRIAGLTADLQRERRTRQEHERQVAQYKADLEAEKRRVQALAGLTPNDPANQQTDAIKEQFLALFPELKPFISLSEEQRQALLQAPTATATVQRIEQREWAQRGRVMVDTAASQLADELGVESLSADQKDDLRGAFGSWFKATVERELQASGGESSATLDRYETGDSALVSDFVKRHTSNWVAPGRRAATATAVNRASQRVPDSTGRSAISQTTRPEKFKDLDERIAFAANLAKERGVNFRG